MPPYLTLGHRFLCARHPKRVRAAKERWESSHDESLVDLLADSLCGDMKTLALTLLKGKRDTDDTVDEKLARKQSNQLHDGGVDYIATLCSNSHQQNARVARFFEETYDMSLRRAISQVPRRSFSNLPDPSRFPSDSLRRAISPRNTRGRSRTPCSPCSLARPNGMPRSSRRPCAARVPTTRLFAASSVRTTRRR